MKTVVLEIPNPLHSFYGLFFFINSNVINNVINISLIIFISKAYLLLSNLVLHCQVLICHRFKTLSHIKHFRTSQNRALN